ncbi:endonuclease domain-containing protein [Arenimonas oryziterrae]
MRNSLSPPRGERARVRGISSRPTVMSHPQSPQRERELRRSQTDAEARFWFHVRDRRLAGAKFRRQHAIGPFIVDFVCIEYALIVELDGSQHIEQCAYDERRSEFLRRRGYRVLRFWNDDVLLRMEIVLECVLVALTPALSCALPSVVPQAGEGVHCRSKIPFSPPGRRCPKGG